VEISQGFVDAKTFGFRRVDYTEWPSFAKAFTLVGHFMVDFYGLGTKEIYLESAEGYPAIAWGTVC
jgi:hypothetical protein